MRPSSSVNGSCCTCRDAPTRCDRQISCPMRSTSSDASGSSTLSTASTAKHCTSNQAGTLITSFRVVRVLTGKLTVAMQDKAILNNKLVPYPRYQPGTSCIAVDVSLTLPAKRLWLFAGLHKNAYTVVTHRTR